MVGEWLMNPSGTALLVVPDAEHNPHNGTVGESSVAEFAAAGYAPVPDDVVIPAQEHEVRALSRVRLLGEDEDPRQAGATVRPLMQSAAVTMRRTNRDGEDEEITVPDELVVITHRAGAWEVMEHRQDTGRPGVILPDSGGKRLRFGEPG